MAGEIQSFSSIRSIIAPETKKEYRASNAQHPPFALQ
jgi:hypothetical protein